MAKRLLLVVGFLCLPFFSWSQTMTGLVVDEDGQPVVSAYVIAGRAVDSISRATAITDESGRFTLTPTGAMPDSVQIVYIGYRPMRFAFVAGDAGTLRLEPDAVAIDEVRVVADRISRTPSGYQVRLMRADLSRGKTSAELLPFLPHVSHEDGSYRIFGRPVSAIYIDGQRCSDASELESIPGDLIDQVNVKFLPEGGERSSLGGGVLEIILRRPPERGYYGDVRSSIEYSPELGYENAFVNALVSYRRDALSLFTYFRYNNNDAEGRERYYYRYGTSQPSIYNQTTLFNDHSGMARVSLVYDFSKKRQLSCSYFVNGDVDRRDVHSVHWIDGEIPSTRVKLNYLTQEGTLKYAAKLGSTTRFSLVGDYYFRSMSSVLKEGDQPAFNDESSTHLAKLSADFKTKVNFGKEIPITMQLEYGASVQNLASHLVPLSSVVPGSKPVTMLESETRTLSPLTYLSAEGIMLFFQYRIGLNGQVNMLSYRDFGPHATIDRTVQWQLNPFVQLAFPLDRKGRNALLMTYKRTLDDVPYSAISSRVVWNTANTYTVGNPDLLAPSTDQAMLGFSLFKNLLNISLVYGHSLNAIYWTTETDSAGFVRKQPFNLPSMHALGASVELNLNPVKAWRSKLSAQFSVVQERATIRGQMFDNLFFRHSYNWINSFTFPKGWGGTLKMNLEPTYYSYDQTLHRVYLISAKIYKEFFKRQFEVGLSSNIYGQNRVLERLVQQFLTIYENTTPIFDLRLSLVWRFSGGKRSRASMLEGQQSYNEVKDIY